MKELISELETTSFGVPVRLRDAVFDDAQILYRWVNEKHSLAAKLNTEGSISWERHVAWFRGRLEISTCRIWIAERAGRPVGQVRVEKAEAGLEVDIYVVVSDRRQGTGLEMLKNLAERCAEMWPGANLIARVLKSNPASQRLFEAAGYENYTNNEDHFVYVMKQTT